MQFGSVNGADSDLLEISTGFPQGSILALLGPILFPIYANDAQFISRLIHLVLYADDMNILVPHKNINTLVSAMKKELQILYDWMLTIKVVKTSCILFSSGQKRVSLDLFNSRLNIELNATPINRKEIVILKKITTFFNL